MSKNKKSVPDHSSCHLIVFTKNDKLEKVKTRIAASAGESYARRLHRQLLDILKNTLKSNHGFTVSVYYSEEVDHTDAWPLAVTKKVQVGANLGARMLHALQTELLQNKVVLLIGSDIPDLSVDILALAFEKGLAGNMVIGPSSDGGYYLIGGMTISSTIFSEVVWGTNGVFEQTTKNLQKLRLPYCVLPTLTDVDNVEEIPGWINDRLQ